MTALKAKNPLTESFLIQLDVDLEASGLDIRVPTSALPFQSVDGFSSLQTEPDPTKCSPLFHIRQSQPEGQNPDTTYTQSAQLNVPLRGVDSHAPSGDPSSQTNRWAGRPHNNGSLDVDQIGQQVWAEMDTSPDPPGNSSTHSKPHSDHTTPSSFSNKTSSHTSFSPQNLDSSYGTSSSGVSPTLGSKPYHGPAALSQFQPQAASFSSHGSHGMNQPFAMPASWDYSQDGPANTGTSLRHQDPRNISYAGPEVMDGSTGITPRSIPDWQGPDTGENWMYGDWAANTPQPL